MFTASVTLISRWDLQFCYPHGMLLFKRTIKPTHITNKLFIFRYPLTSASLLFSLPSDTAVSTFPYNVYVTMSRTLHVNSDPRVDTFYNLNILVSYIRPSYNMCRPRHYIVQRFTIVRSLFAFLFRLFVGCAGPQIA